MRKKLHLVNTSVTTRLRLTLWTAWCYEPSTDVLSETDVLSGFWTPELNLTTLNTEITSLDSGPCVESSEFVWGTHKIKLSLSDWQVDSSRPVFSMEESLYNRAFSSSQSESFHGRQGIYTRKQSLLPPSSSSSSNIIISDPGGRSRLPSDRFSVVEKTEGPLFFPEASNALRLSDIREGQSTGVSTGVHRDDVTAVKTEILQRDDDMKTNQSRETLQE